MQARYEKTEYPGVFRYIEKPDRYDFSVFFNGEQYWGREYTTALAANNVRQLYEDFKDIHVGIDNIDRATELNVLVSPEDRHLLREYRVSVNPLGYALVHSNGRKVLLHHLILPKKRGLDIDHINGVRADNRRDNLRYATRSQNLCNCRTKSTNTTGVKGVSFNRQIGKYRSYVCFKGRNIWLGHFATLEEAAAMREEKAREMHGAFYNSGRESI